MFSTEDSSIMLPGKDNIVILSPDNNSIVKIQLFNTSLLQIVNRTTYRVSTTLVSHMLSTEDAICCVGYDVLTDVTIVVVRKSSMHSYFFIWGLIYPPQAEFNLFKSLLSPLSFPMSDRPVQNYMSNRKHIALIALPRPHSCGIFVTWLRCSNIFIV